MTHTFLLHPHNAEHRQSCHDYIKALDEGKKWKVIVCEYVKDRSIEKNAEYFGYILRPAADQLGYESVYDLHRLICIEIFGAHKIAFSEDLRNVEPNNDTPNNDE